MPTTDGTVGVLGLALKPRTDDLRGSPALDIIGRLLEEGIHVRAHEPRAAAIAPDLPNVRCCGDAYEAVSGCDAVLLATEWEEYLALDWRRVRELMCGEVIVDGRNALDPGLLTNLGFGYIGIGRGAWTDGRRVATSSDALRDEVT